MNTKATVHEQIYRARRMWPFRSKDPDFYDAKKWLRKRLRSTLKDFTFVVMIEGGAVRVCYGNESVVI